MSRFEHAASCKDICRISLALIEQFIDGFSRAPKNLILDMEHFEDAVHGQQSLTFYNHHYRSTCYLPLMIFDGQPGALVAAVLRPGKRPTGARTAFNGVDLTLAAGKFVAAGHDRAAGAVSTWRARAGAAAMAEIS